VFSSPKKTGISIIEGGGGTMLRYQAVFNRDEDDLYAMKKLDNML
jgi:hypothetical protein